MWGKFVYREIEAPARIVFVSSFSDEAGNITRAPFHANWPLEVLNTIAFSEHEGKTTLTLTALPLNATDEEGRTFEGGFESMQQGFGGTFDGLQDYLLEMDKKK